MDAGRGSPGASQGKGRVTTISWRNASNTMAPAKASSELERGDDVGLVALRLAGEIEPELVRPCRADRAVRQVAGRVQPAAQLGDLPVEHRHGDAGPALDPGEHLPLGQRIEPGQHQPAEQHAERGHVGRVRQRLRRGLQLGLRSRRCARSPRGGSRLRRPSGSSALPTPARSPPRPRRAADRR